MMMGVKSKGIAFIILFFLGLCLSFPLCSSEANQPRDSNKPAHPTSANRLGSSAVFQLQGNVYPLGYYTVSLSIGSSPKIFDLDIDSGSDLTWVQCDAPCRGCTKPRDKLYKPNNNVVQCSDQLCSRIHLSTSSQCSAPDEQCHYEVEYADNGASLGVLVRDFIPLQLTNGSVIRPQIAFGCGYDQKFSGPNPPPSTAGVLGLGSGKASILSQLHSLGLTRNVVGHCLSGQGGGYLFFGDDLIPSSGVVWTPMLSSSSEMRYSSGPAELLFNGKPSNVKGLEVIFDSGSSYTYFHSKAYQAVVDLVINDLKGSQLTRATEDPSLPICWKGAKPFKSLRDVKSYFKPLALSFTKRKKVLLPLPPEAYLIVTGNKRNHMSNMMPHPDCFGILNGDEVGLEDLNIIGDISFQDKMVIYDNEKQQIGWVPSNCDRLPNVDRDFDDVFSLPYAANFDILADH